MIDRNAEETYFCMFFEQFFKVLQNAARVDVGIKAPVVDPLVGMSDNAISHAYFIDQNGNIGK